MKKIIIALSVIFLIVLVSAATLQVFDVRRVEITKETRVAPTPSIMQFDCDGQAVTINSTEPDGKYDKNDIRSAVQGSCNGTVTNIQLDGRYWQVNKYGKEGFNQTVLKMDECSRNTNNRTQYDSKTNDCLEPVVELEIVR